MSYYSEKDEAIYFDLKLCVKTNENVWDTVWQNLKINGYIWQDIKGKKYKANELTIRYLKNILEHCKKFYRPEEQIKQLELTLKCKEGNI